MPKRLNQTLFMRSKPERFRNARVPWNKSSKSFQQNAVNSYGLRWLPSLKLRGRSYIKTWRLFWLQERPRCRPVSHIPAIRIH
jgi:hypothetical protein